MSAILEDCRRIEPALQAYLKANDDRPNINFELLSILSSQPANNFIQRFAPHLTRRLIERAAGAATQADVETLTADVELPTK